MKMPQLLRKIKRNEEDDFCSRLQMELMEGIVLNDSLK